MFQVKATRSRQKQSSTNKAAAASMSLVVSASWKFVSHAVTAVPAAELSTGRSVVISVIKALQIGVGGFGGQPVTAKYPPVRWRAQARGSVSWMKKGQSLSSFSACL